MFCAPQKCIMSPEACLYNKQVALRAIQKLIKGKAITYLEIDRVVAFKSCVKGNQELAESALQALFDGLVEKLEKSRC